MIEHRSATDRELLVRMFEAAVAAAQPVLRVPLFLPERPNGRTVVIGAGKASARMAQTLEQAWPGPLKGLVITRYGYAVPCRSIEIVEAAHPVPDIAGLRATERLVSLLQGLTADDLVIALISGGGSALLCAPALGLDFEDERELNRALLASGAPISVMNVIRNQFSTVKGGRLAALCHPARVATLVLSDVPGDDPSLVASGPTIASACERAAARSMVERMRLNLPQKMREYLLTDANPAPSHADPAFCHDVVHTIGSATISLEAASRVAEEAGLVAHILSDALEGEAKVVAGIHAAIAREVVLKARPFAKPCVILSGGETTVTLSCQGRGGRNGEYSLALALGIEGLQGISAIACDTDGIDGSESNAGAFVDGTSSRRMRAAGVDPAASLACHRSYDAFAAVADLICTGPTGTNVNDFRAMILR